jgi:hypothetical protein
MNSCEIRWVRIEEENNYRGRLMIGAIEREISPSISFSLSIDNEQVAKQEDEKFHEFPTLILLPPSLILL